MSYTQLGYGNVGGEIGNFNLSIEGPTTPEQMPGFIFWFDPSNDGYVISNTQPNLLNGSFDDASTWVDSGATWTVGAGVAQAAGGTGNNTLSQSPNLISGNRYLSTIVVDAVGGMFYSTINVNIGITGVGILRSSPGTYIDSVICSGDLVFYLTPGSYGAATLSNVTIENISILTIEPVNVNIAYLGSSFDQITSASMGWKNLTLINGLSSLASTATNGTMVWSEGASEAKFLHSNAFTLFYIFKSTSIATAQTIVCTSDGDEWNHGFYSDLFGSQLRIKIGNGTGVLNHNFAFSTILSSDTLYIVAVRKKNGRLSVWVNGDLETQNETGTPSTNNPTNTFYVGNSSASNNIIGAKMDQITYDIALGDRNVGVVGLYLAEKWNGSWA